MPESLQTTDSVLYKNGSKYLKSLQEHLRFLGFANTQNDNTSQGAFNPFQADVPLLFPLKKIRKPRQPSRAIWTLEFIQFWAHKIWVPKLKICVHMCGEKM